jgi:hypothetical protein
MTTKTFPKALLISVLAVFVVVASQGAFNVAPTCEADAGTTKMIGIQYTQTDGSTVAYQADELNGATAQTFGTAALLVTEVYVGDVENARDVDIKVGAEEDELHGVGRATADASAAANTTVVLSF